MAHSMGMEPLEASPARGQVRAGVSESSAERRRVRRRATQSEQLVQGRVDLDMRRIEMLFEEPLHLELNSKFLNNSLTT